LMRRYHEIVRKGLQPRGELSRRDEADL